MRLGAVGEVHFPHNVTAVRIQSPRFDLSLFTLSPLAGLLVVLPALASPKGIYVWIAATYLVAIPHYVSSFSFYMGDENLAY